MVKLCQCKQGNEVYESLLYYQDMISSGILLFAAFILLRLFTHNKPSMTATDTTSRSRRETVTPAATGAVIEPCALLVTEGMFVVVVGERDAVTEELKVDPFLGTAKQRILFLKITV